MATFQNQATLSYNGTVTTSNITTGELLDPLTATKTAVMDNYTARDDVTFIISILNSGSTALSDITVTDNLGSYQFNGAALVPLSYVVDSIHYYVNGVLQSAPTVANQNPLTVTGINIPAGGNVSLIYEARANQFAPLSAGSSITNTATVSGAGIPTPITAEEVINAENAAELTISKSVSPSTVTDNSQISYTFVIQNSGNTAADTDVVVTDTFTPALDAISVTLDGTPLTLNTDYTYDAISGQFSTVAGRITVPAATYTQNAVNGNWIVNPGVSVLTVTGTI